MKSYVVWLLMFGAFTSGASGQVSDDRHVTVTPLFERYDAGSVVRLAVNNPTDALLHRSSCGTIVQRASGTGTWEAIGRPSCPPDRSVGVALVMPHSTSHVDVPLPPSLAAGDYRVVLDMRFETGPMLTDTYRTSTRFRIEPAQR
jgi:hypothetical protein